MIILGIDPGTIITGYGLIRVDGSRHEVLDYGCVKPPPKNKLSQRYLIIYQSLEALINQYSPDAVSVETQYVGKNPQSAIKLGMARGVIILLATLKKIPVFEYTPSKVKSAVVGRGQASKEQVQGMVQMLLSLEEPPEPEDAADALALAICHANNRSSPTAAKSV